LAFTNIRALIVTTPLSMFQSILFENMFRNTYVSLQKKKF